MVSKGWLASSVRSIPVPAALLVAALAVVASVPAAAGGFPSTVAYEGEALDAAGLPLAGVYPMSFTYFGPDGEKLFAESLDAVRVSGGRFAVEFGSGALAGQHAFASLGEVLAAQPEVRLEIAIDGVVYGPRVGIQPAGHSLESRLVAAGLRAADDGDDHWKHYEAPGGATSTQSAVLAPVGAARAEEIFDPNARRRPYTLPVIGPRLSRPVRDLPIARQQPVKEDKEVNPPRHETLFDENGNRFGTIAPKVDDAAVPRAPVQQTPALDFQFAGIGNVNGVLPPDTEGTVGPNHYVQVVNLSFAVYDKTGNLLTGPSNTNTLWAGFGGPCQTDNSGDAIFMYDEQADRFVLTQFAVGGSNQSVCWAVSTTPDPTGTYFLYEVVTPRFPDYYKVGVWPDPDNNAYFFGTNSGFQGQYDVFAVDRANMLAGAAARPMQFFQNFVNLMMPADLDGYGGGAGAPPAGSPGIFYTFRDGGEPYFSSPPSDSIDIWEFDVDWVVPANSTFTLVDSITPAQGLADFNWTVCGFFVSNCIPQPGTAQGIDSASWWPMQRLVYRNFGSHETLVGTWTVDVLSAGNRAAPRWFELRDTGSGWTIYQQGTHSPDAIHRWMPSIAMDGDGNIALGYSRGDGSNFPSIYYATREAADPLGQLDAEALLFAGTGSQTHSAARWGDYSSMEVDPADDCTFWYTTEYLATTSSANWLTRVGTFTIPGCGGPPVPDFTLSCSPSSFTIQQNANDTSSCAVTAINGYSGSVSLSCAGAPAGISCGFAPNPGSPTFNSTLTIDVAQSQATGSFNFDVEATDGTITKTFGVSVTVTPEGSNGPQIAVFDPTLQAPRCDIPGSSCDTVSLVDSRDSLSPSEPNQPNTINDSCADGTSGSYHNDESNDRIVVSTLDGGNFTEGDTVQIDATVWAWSTGSQDTLDLYYAADATNPTWVFITSIGTPTGGAQTLSAQYTLPTGSLQAVRAQFRYQGSASPCTVGNWNDRDDLVFAVETPVQCTVDADCDDGLFCNGGEVCNAGACEAGTPPACDDGLFCNGAETCNETTDTCDAGTPPACDDGLFCNGAETCNESTDSCDSGTPPACDDGLFCNGTETCNEGTDTCDAGTPPSCDDGVGCTVDTCDAGTDSCQNAPSDALCDNGLFCDGAETCDPVLDCQAGSDPCPGQTCDEGSDTCVACLVDADCDNGLFCDGAETCNAGVCQPGTPPVIDDGVGCTDDSCDEVNDVVVNAPNDANCDNGLFCDGAETCDAVSDCQAGTPPAVDDGVGCTDDSCDEVNDVIVNAPNDANCDNGLFCDGAETCDAVDDCQVGSDPCPGLTCDEVNDMCVGGSNPVIWMSFRSNTAVPGVGTVTDDDIVSYDETSGQWSYQFDGSDVGLGSFEIDGLAILPGGDLLLSFTGAGTIGGLSVDDSDVVRFTPTSMGTTTAGSFSMYFDGSDVGLSSNGEDVDSIALHPDGRLIISTLGSMSANGASGRDEDLFLFTGTLGPSTSGSFSLYFDGSDVGLADSGGEDVDAAGFTAANGLLFSTVGSFAVSGASGEDEDVAEFNGTYGSSTSGSFSLRLDLSALGIDAGEDVGSLHIVE